MPAHKIGETKSWDEIVSLVEEKVSSAVRYKGKFREWFKSKENIGYLFDYFLVARAYNIVYALHEDRDHFCVIAGREGDGKSTLGIQLCSYIDPYFNPSRICFTPLEFIWALKKAEKGQAILIDEGGMTLFSREAMSLTNRMFTKSFMIMRQKNLFVCICIPNFFLLDTYIRNHRVNTLIKILERGKYQAYTGFGITKVSKDGSKYMNISGIKVPDGTSWKGYFNKTMPCTLPLNIYLEHKQRTMDLLLEQAEDEVEDVRFISTTKVMHDLRCSNALVLSLIKDGHLHAKKIGYKWYIHRESYKKLLAEGTPSTSKHHNAK